MTINLSYCLSYVNVNAFFTGYAVHYFCKKTAPQPQPVTEEMEALTRVIWNRSDVTVINMNDVMNMMNMTQPDLPPSYDEIEKNDLPTYEEAVKMQCFHPNCL